MKNKLSIQISAFLLTFLAFGGTLVVSGQEVDFSKWEQIKPRNIGPAGMSGRVTAIDVDLTDRDRCLLYTSPSPRDLSTSRMPSSA